MDALRCDMAEKKAVAGDECSGAFESLHFRESPRIEAVLGRSGLPETEVFAARCDADGVPVVRRSSGGGTVLTGPGCLVYSLIFDRRHRPEMNGIDAIHNAVLRRITAALRPHTTAAIRCEGTCDLTLIDYEKMPVASHKFSGNAVRLRTHTILYHGTILYDFPLERMAWYLQEPLRRPDYRADRTHADFLVNFPASRDTIIRAITEAFCK